MPVHAHHTQSAPAPQATDLVGDAWSTEIVPHLPINLDAQAHSLKAFQRVRGLACPADLLRAILAYMSRDKMQARNLSPLDLVQAIDNYNIFLPTGGAKFGGTDYALDSNSMYELVDRMGEIPVKSKDGRTIFLKDVASPKDANLMQTSVVRVSTRPPTS